MQCSGCRHWRAYVTDRDALQGWGECDATKQDGALIYGVYRTYATFYCAHAEILEAPIKFSEGVAGGEGAGRLHVHS